MDRNNKAGRPYRKCVDNVVQSWPTTAGLPCTRQNGMDTDYKRKRRRIPTGAELTVYDDDDDDDEMIT